MMPTATWLAALALNATEVPEGFIPRGSIEAYVETDGDAANESPWWERFDDPELARTIQTALANNYDVKAAAARILQAEAQTHRALAPLLPSVTGDGNLSFSRGAALGFQFGGLGRGGPTPSVVYNASALVNARWQLDVFGQSYLAYQAAELQEAVNAGERDNVAFALAGQVASAYFDVVQTKNAIALVEEQIEANERLLELLELRFERGESSGLDVLQQKQQFSARAAELPPLRSQLRAAEQRLATLMALTPSEGRPATAATLPSLPPAPALGSPRDLLENRPDLRASLARAESAEKQLSSSKRVHLPTLSANAFAGRRFFFSDYDNAELEELRQNPNVPPDSVPNEEVRSTWDWGGGVALSIPIFSGFGDVGQVQEARATRRNVVETLNQSFLNAVRDVETAAFNEREIDEQLRLLREQARAAEAALEESEARYVNGLADYLSVLTALTASQNAARAVLQAERSLLAARLQLYQALGGPWTRSLTAAGGQP